MFDKTRHLEKGLSWSGAYVKHCNSCVTGTLAEPPLQFLKGTKVQVLMWLSFIVCARCSKSSRMKREYSASNVTLQMNAGTHPSTQSGRAKTHTGSVDASLCLQKMHLKAGTIGWTTVAAEKNGCCSVA